MSSGRSFSGGLGVNFSVCCYESGILERRTCLHEGLDAR